MASVEGIDSKLEEIYRIHDEKVAQEKRDTGNIEAISAETTAAKVAELPYAKKPEDYAEYKDIKEYPSMRLLWMALALLTIARTTTLSAQYRKSFWRRR